MKAFLVLTLAFTFLHSDLGFGRETQSRHRKKSAHAKRASRQKGAIDLTPDFNPSKHASNEEAMKNTKFKLAPKKDALEVGVTCTDTSGRMLKSGEPGYESCITDASSRSPERRTNAGPTATIPVLGN